MGAQALLQELAGIDPAPLFAVSLLPYLLFLWWSWRSGRLPRLAFWGFCLTLLFVVSPSSPPWWPRASTGSNWQMWTPCMGVPKRS